MHKVFQVVIGDWSNDGHGRTETLFVEANETLDKIREAYTAGSKKVGFDFCEDVATNFEDNKVPRAKLEVLQAHGMPLTSEFGHLSLDCETFFDIYRKIVKLGNPSIEMASIGMDKINIGGYGLFPG